MDRNILKHTENDQRANTPYVTRAEWEQMLNTLRAQAPSTSSTSRTRPMDSEVPARERNRSHLHTESENDQRANTDFLTRAEMEQLMKANFRAQMSPEMTTTQAIEQLETRLIHRITEKVHNEIETLKASISDKMRKNADEIKMTVTSQSENNRKKLRDSINGQIKTVRTHLETQMLKHKREIFAFTEKEFQLVRDRFEGPLRPHKVYTLDFYVDNFKSLIKSDTERHSSPWHINQFKSSIQGKVKFLNNGKLKVSMVYGRHLHEVGLPPGQPGNLQIKASIHDTSGQLPSLEVGDKPWTFNEESNNDSGVDLGEVDCQAVTDRVHDDRPGYQGGSMLLRFVVEVFEPYPRQQQQPNEHQEQQPHQRRNDRGHQRFYPQRGRPYNRYN